jgi:hypothetical protein
MGQWVIEGKQLKLLHRKEVVYKRVCPEGELGEEVKQAIQHGSHLIKLEQVP